MVLAEFLLCLVVAIADGDTLTVRCGDEGQYQQVKIRLAEIDAPEKSQPFGQQSKQYLSNLCFGQQAQIAPRAQDRYGRTVARVECKGEDASAAMVKSGLAWAYTKYLTDPEIERLAAQARADKVGLWAAPDAVPPWAYRHQK